MIHTLTPREKIVMLYTGRGYTAREIAEDMNIAPKTVETYKHRGAAKLALSAREYRREAYSYALRRDKRGI